MTNIGFTVIATIARAASTLTGVALKGAVVSAIIEACLSFLDSLSDKKVLIDGESYEIAEVVLAILALAAGALGLDFKKYDANFGSRAEAAKNKVFSKKTGQFGMLIRAIKGLATTVQAWFKANVNAPSGSAKSLRLPSLNGTGVATELRVSHGKDLSVSMGSKVWSFFKGGLHYIVLTWLLTELYEVWSNPNLSFGDWVTSLHKRFGEASTRDLSLPGSGASSDDAGSVRVSGEGSARSSAVEAKIRDDKGNGLVPHGLTVGVLKQLVHPDTFDSSVYASYDPSRALELVQNRSLELHKSEVMSGLNLNSVNLDAVVNSFAVLVLLRLRDLGIELNELQIKED